MAVGDGRELIAFRAIVLMKARSAKHAKDAAEGAGLVRPEATLPRRRVAFGAPAAKSSDSKLPQAGARIRRAPKLFLSPAPKKSCGGQRETCLASAMARGRGFLIDLNAECSHRLVPKGKQQKNQSKSS